VVAICFATIIFDGYDLIVYGAVVPSLLEYRAWGLTPPEAGVIGSYALIGMLIGALVVGTITDIVGRRKIMLFCISWFSLAMGLCALAPSPELFGLFRFIAGLGLGGVIPTAIALTVEYSPPGRRNLNNALMFSGYSVGGILSALLAIALVPAFGWRVMFWIGLAPLVLILPLAYKFLPESVGFLLAKGRREEALEYARRFDLPIDLATDAAQETAGESPAGGGLGVLARLFSRGYVAATLLFWAASFIGLLLVYGLNTWLPQLMREAGYPLGSALSFLLVLNLGAILGAISASFFADRFGSKPVTGLAFLAAAVSTFLLSFQLPSLALYALVAVAGFGTIGTQILVNAYVATHYPAGNRATALGWSLGVGRLGAILGPAFGGIVLASGLGFEWNFYAFAIPALLGALVVLLVPRSPAAEQHGSIPAQKRSSAAPTA
jgi:AAHS family benzoate transporter-like MFS transporter